MEDDLSKSCDLKSNSGDNLSLQDLTNTKNDAWSDLLEIKKKLGDIA